jgi:BASS family bile acid:Na+ symporter
LFFPVVLGTISKQLGTSSINASSLTRLLAAIDWLCVPRFDAPKVTSPFAMHVLLPVIAGSEPLKIDPVKIIATLLLTQLLPLALGLAVRHRRPKLAESLKRPGNRLSTVLNLAVFSVIMVVQFHLLESIKAVGFAGMLALLIVTFVIGWLLGGPASSQRTAMGFSTGVRNVGVSLVIATASFPGTPAVTSALAYALFQTIILALMAVAWGRWAASASAAAEETGLSRSP